MNKKTAIGLGIIAAICLAALTVIVIINVGGNDKPNATVHVTTAPPTAPRAVTPGAGDDDDDAEPTEQPNNPSAPEPNDEKAAGKGARHLSLAGLDDTFQGGKTVGDIMTIDAQNTLARALEYDYRGHHANAPKHLTAKIDKQKFDGKKHALSFTVTVKDNDFRVTYDTKKDRVHIMLGKRPIHLD